MHTDDCEKLMHIRKKTTYEVYNLDTKLSEHASHIEAEKEITRRRLTDLLLDKKLADDLTELLYSMPGNEIVRVIATSYPIQHYYALKALR